MTEPTDFPTAAAAIWWGMATLRTVHRLQLKMQQWCNLYSVSNSFFFFSKRITPPVGTCLIAHGMGANVAERESEREGVRRNG